uniref:Uncharacterized protein n=1 Tax=Meloidogyne enterolobii TaxID=390850 RepID=A0A6V7WDZ6_MELEN|nr:unnamed protein product [Meloidogyne enterolobii]
MMMVVFRHCWLVFGTISIALYPPPPSLFVDKTCCCFACFGTKEGCCIWTSSIWFCFKTSRGGCGALFSNIKSTSPLWHIACVL